MDCIDYKKLDTLIADKYTSNKDFMGVLNSLGTLIKEDAIKKWRQGNSVPKSNDLPNIAKALDVSVLDLYCDPTSQKEKIITEAIKNPSIKIKNYLIEAGYGSDRIKEVDLLDGYGSEPEDEFEDRIRTFFIDKYIVDKKYRDKKISALVITSDSMTPYVYIGDIVLFATLGSGANLSDGKYIIDTIDGKKLHNLKFHLDGSVTVSSENEKYRAERVSRASENFSIIGRVIGRILKS